MHVVVLYVFGQMPCIVKCAVLDVETQVELSESRRKSSHEMVEEDTQTEPSVMPRASMNKSHDVRPPTLSGDDDDDVTKIKHRYSKMDKHRHKHDQETQSPSRKNLSQNFTFDEQ